MTKLEGEGALEIGGFEMRDLEPAHELAFADESKICNVLLKRTSSN